MSASDPPPGHRRRPRYPGKNPRRFAEKYKEHSATAHPVTAAKVLASGKTLAGTHRPIMMAEILAVLAPRAGETAVDCTLGYGGHARELLACVLPGGRLLGLDADPIELAKTEARLRANGDPAGALEVRRSNFAGLPAVLASLNLAGTDCLLADLGVSSMQLDDPVRGFSMREDGPLDMRMNPARGLSAADWLAAAPAARLEEVLRENADEPRSAELAMVLAGRRFDGTRAFARAIREALPPRMKDDDAKIALRRVFQAVRIAVNEELSALETLLRALPTCLRPGGRAAILTFHSGEDRRVKKAFQAGHRAGLYRAIAEDPQRPSRAEVAGNSRASSAKLRWAIRA